MIISQQGLWTLPTWVPTCLDAFKEHPIILGRPFLSAPMPGLLLSSEDSSERVLQWLWPFEAGAKPFGHGGYRAMVLTWGWVSSLNPTWVMGGPALIDLTSGMGAVPSSTLQGHWTRDLVGPAWPRLQLQTCGDAPRKLVISRCFKHPLASGTINE